MPSAARVAIADLLLLAWGTILLGSFTPFAVLAQMSAMACAAKLLFCLSGMLAALMMRFARRFWRAAVVGSSALYLVKQNFPFVLIDLFLSDGAGVDQILSRVRLFSLHPGALFSLAYYDLVLPVCLLSVAIYTLVQRDGAQQK